MEAKSAAAADGKQRRVNHALVVLGVALSSAAVSLVHAVCLVREVYEVEEHVIVLSFLDSAFCFGWALHCYYMSRFVDDPPVAGDRANRRRPDPKHAASQLKDSRLAICATLLTVAFCVSFGYRVLGKDRGLQINLYMISAFFLGSGVCYVDSHLRPFGFRFTGPGDTVT